MEKVVWAPPKLTFTIERHGGTVRGSSRAELQHWTVDVKAMTATLDGQGSRQLRPMQRSIDVARIAEEVAQLVLSCEKDSRLSWKGENRVKVHIDKILPDGSAVKQTLASRRKRFWLALDERLSLYDWVRNQSYYERHDR